MSCTRLINDVTSPGSTLYAALKHRAGAEQPELPDRGAHGEKRALSRCKGAPGKGRYWQWKAVQAGVKEGSDYRKGYVKGPYRYMTVVVLEGDD